MATPARPWPGRGRRCDLLLTDAGFHERLVALLRACWTEFFAASQFLSYFDWIGLGQVVAIRGAGLVESPGVAPVVLFLGPSLLVTVVTSSSRAGPHSGR